MKDRNLDIFSVFSALNRHDHQLWARLSEDERKEISALVLTKWMAGTNDGGQLIMLNSIMNHMLFAGLDQERLLDTLACVPLTNHRYQWVSSKSKGAKHSIKVICEYYDISEKEAVEKLDLISNGELIGLAMDLGWEKASVTALERELST